MSFEEALVRREEKKSAAVEAMRESARAGEESQLTSRAMARQVIDEFLAHTRALQLDPPVTMVSGVRRVVENRHEGWSVGTKVVSSKVVHQQEVGRAWVVDYPRPKQFYVRSDGGCFQRVVRSTELGRERRLWRGPRLWAVLEETTFESVNLDPGISYLDPDGSDITHHLSLATALVSLLP